MEVSVEDVDMLNKELSSSITASTQPATRKEQADITSILNFREAMEADMAALHEDTANLWEVIKMKFDDVEKGEGEKVIKRPVQPSRVAVQKAYELMCLILHNPEM